LPFVIENAQVFSYLPTRSDRLTATGGDWAQAGSIAGKIPAKRSEDLTPRLRQLIATISPKIASVVLFC